MSQNAQCHMRKGVCKRETNLRLRNKSPFPEAITMSLLGCNGGKRYWKQAANTAKNKQGDCKLGNFRFDYRILQYDIGRKLFRTKRKIMTKEGTIRLNNALTHALGLNSNTCQL